MLNKKLNFLLPLLMSFILVIGMLVGFKLRETTWYKKPIREKMQYNRLEEIMSLIETKYVDSVDKEKILARIAGEMLTDLDPHSFYIAATELEGMNESLEGNFEGIGIEFYVLRDTITVVSPIAGGPSEALGIMSGDKIIKIEDTLVAGVEITNSDVVRKLRGKKGTEVKVSIQRNIEKELLDFTIKRDKIPIASVDVAYMIDAETGYIKINRFSANTYEEFMNEMRKLKDLKMEKLVLDLRQNPGGYLNAATMIADELISGDQLLVYTEGKAYKRKEYRAGRSGIFEEGDVAIIIDEGSASASEILAGAVQDLDRGIVTGRRSFGKGLVQEQYSLGDGSALRLTVARYYTPSGRSIQRPYENGTEDYYNDLQERFLHGEFVHKDSIIQPDSVKYFTKSGKVVYGGGGIMPDFFIPFDTTRNFQDIARMRGFIPEFIYDHFGKNSEKYKSFRSVKEFIENFEISNSLYADFISVAKEKGLEFSDVKLASLEDDIKIFLKAQIARQLWRNEGFFAVINTRDSTLQKTIEVLQNPELAKTE